VTQDLSQGYGLNCFHMRSGEWDLTYGAAVWAFRVELLPELHPCHEVVGRVTREAAALTGLAQGTPVVAGGLNAACGTLGAGVTEPARRRNRRAGRRHEPVPGSLRRRPG
jgi:xylulokinase